MTIFTTNHDKYTDIQMVGITDSVTGASPYTKHNCISCSILLLNNGDVILCEP